MCNSCCSHKQLHAQSEHICSPDVTRGQLYHAGLFRLHPQGIVFPGEHIILDVYVASALRLFAELKTTGLQAPEHAPEHDWQWPTERAELLTRAFAVAPSETSPFGALAVFDFEDAPSTTQFAHFTRFRALVVGRYILQGPAHVHNIYPCVPIRLVCDIEPVSLNMPLSRAYPFTAPRPEARRKHSKVMTRSANATEQEFERRRTSAYMGGLSYVHWRALDPQVLVRRARTSAMFARLDLDKFLLAHPPPDDGCPSCWSFWLCAGLPMETKPGLLLDLLGETSVVVRLRKVIRVLQESTWKKRRRSRSSKDAPFRVPESPKRLRRCSGPGSSGQHVRDTKDAQKEERGDMQHLEKMLELNPWPSSAANGFSRVKPGVACRGRFRQLRPSRLGDVQQKETSTDDNNRL